MMYRKSIKLSMFFLSLFSMAVIFSYGQDTIRISEKDINTKVLKKGTHRYLVYFTSGKNTPRTDVQFWTRKIERSYVNGNSLITIKQEWEHKDTIVHTVTSVCDGNTLSSIYHEFWWKARPGASVDFSKKKILYDNTLLSDADTARRKKAIWSAFKTTEGVFFLNWHLDMEVFPALPYKKGVTFIIPFYDPGTSAPFEKVTYTVTGTAQLAGYDNQKIDCWIMEHKSDGNKEVFWISKKTKEVLKLEQEINGKFYRYKIKLGFSM